MRLASYLWEGERRYGVVSDEGLIHPEAGATGFGSLRECLAGGGLEALRRRVEEGSPGGAEPVALDAVELLPVIPDPTKVICVGVNYRSHREETNRPVVEHPTIFTRFADTQIAHGVPVRVPEGTEKFDYEGELALVIGRGGRHIPEADALGFVAGYSCYNDLTARDWQRHGGQWTPGKNFPGTGAFGPWLVTSDEVGDVRQLHLETRVNGDVRQSASVSDMLFPIPVLISYISSFTPLSPGDVIVTGTPGGVGLFRDPPEFLAPGDVVEVEISGIGILRNVIR